MKAKPIYRRKRVLRDGLAVEAVVWAVPVPVDGCFHLFKYRLYAGRDGRSLVRYDNERGKGDHKHVGQEQVPYQFTSVKQLLADFTADIERLEGGDE